MSPCAIYHPFPFPPLNLLTPSSPPCLDRKVFLATWKEIPAANEFTSTVSNVTLSTDQAEAKLNANNIFTIARRTVENQDLMYMSAKFVNDIWLLAEFKMVPGTSSVGVSCYSCTLKAHWVFSI